MESFFKTSNGLYFLEGGGKMGELIRKTEWSKTPLGDPGVWPKSLQTTVALMLNNPFGMYIAWGLDYIQLYNDGYRPILGSTKHPHALGISTRETFEEIWHIIGTMFDDVMKGKAVGFPDFMLPLNRNGFVEECYFDFSYSPITKEDGEVGGVLVTVIETTTKKKAEKALKESEERFRTMADNIPNLAWMANADGWIFWYNKKWYEYSGTSPEQMKGWGWESVHNPNELPRVLDKWQSSIVTGQPFEMVFPLKGANGKFRQFLTRVLPMRDSEGKIYQWFGTNTDITEQIEAEQALKESEERFRTMAEGADILIAVGDENSNAVYFNKAWIDFTGRALEELLEFGWVDLIHPDDKERYVNIYLSAFKEKIPFTGEFRVMSRQGDYRWMLAKGPPRFRADGSFAGYISSCVDITEQKEDEQRKNDFIGMVSHELKTPITSIYGYLQLLNAKAVQKADTFNAGIMDKILSQVKRMTSMINGYLNLSRLESGKIYLERQPFLLNELVTEMIEEINSVQKTHTITFLPGDDIAVEADRDKIGTVLSNLLNNAIKYSPGRNGIEVKCQIVHNQAQISIRDEGIGIRQENMEKLFERYYRGKHHIHIPGFGIGLYLSAEIIQRHNGKIWVESEVGNGSTFYFTLPLN
ncbi:MAG: hypothetical protein NVSMB7_05300 [Chitinophagaceae bacterium]